MRRFIFGRLGGIAVGIQAGLILNALPVSPAVAKAASENSSATVPGLKHLSIWNSPAPAPDNAFEGDPECAEPATDALLDAVSEMESGFVH